MLNSKSTRAVVFPAEFVSKLEATSSWTGEESRLVHFKLMDLSIL